MKAGRFPLIAVVLPAAFAAGTLLSHFLLQHAPATLAADLRQPLPVATNWHDFGRLLWLLCFACLLAASSSYVGVLRGLVRGKLTMRLSSILAISSAALVAALLMPVIFSSDVYAYAAYGLMDASGISPYAHTTLSPGVPLFGAAIWQWGNPPPVCVYGPLFVWIAKITVLATARFGIAAELFTLRIISSVALLLCAPLIYLALHGLRSEQRMAAAAGVVLNPVAIWAAAEGHNDTITLAFVLAGFIAVRKLGYFAGAFMIASSALVKASGAAAAAVLALFSWNVKDRFFTIVAGIGCAITLTALIARPFELGVRAVLIPHGHYAPQFSMQFAMAQLVQTVFADQLHALGIGITVTLVAAGLLAFYGARLAIKGDVEGALYLALSLWIAIPNPYPWYGLWILPVAFLSVRSPAAWAIIAASITVFVRYLPDVSMTANADTALVVTMCELGLPLAILATRMLRVPQPSVLETDAAPTRN